MKNIEGKNITYNVSWEKWGMYRIFFYINI